MSAIGPDFISLQVSNLESSAEFYQNYLGLVRSQAGPPQRRSLIPSLLHLLFVTYCQEPNSVQVLSQDLVSPCGLMPRIRKTFTTSLLRQALRLHLHP